MMVRKLSPHQIHFYAKITVTDYTAESKLIKMDAGGHEKLLCFWLIKEVV